MTTITPDTLIKITWGLLATTVIVSMTLGWRVGVLLTRIEARLTEIEDSRFTLPAAAEHALRFALQNPGLSVPDPRDPTKLIRSNRQEEQEYQS